MRKILLSALVIMILLTACTAKKAQEGNKVKVDYTGTLQDGTTFDTSIGKKPLEFTLGEGNMIPGFEKAVYGMQINETKKITIPANEAYGPYSEENIIKVKKEEFPPELVLEVGKQLQMTQPDGQVARATILEISDTDATLDTNHPLAGKDLTFEIKLIEIIESTK